jgi:phosphopantetheinyl transferase
MKIHFLDQHERYTIAMAEILEGQLDVFDHKLAAHPELEHLHPKKKFEFLASRLLVEKTCGEMNIPYHGLVKDEYGKPHLKNSKHQVSITHNYPYVACSIHSSSACGIDIEFPRQQLIKIKHKFLNTHELAYCGEDLNKLCQYWSAKEALYKIYGRKQVLFSEHLSVNVIDNKTLSGKIRLDGHESEHLLKMRKYKNYYIVYNI